MRKQIRRNRWLLAGFVGVVIAAGLCPEVHIPCPTGFGNMEETPCGR